MRLSDAAGWPLAGRARLAGAAGAGRGGKAAQQALRGAPRALGQALGSAGAGAA